MSNTFINTLGDHVFSEAIENSYYNDETDVECYTPDFEAAYQFIRNCKKITEKDLNGYYTPENAEVDENGEATKYTGLDLIKIAVNGDFNDDNNHHSSEIENLKMCLALFEKTNGNKTIWEHKKNKEYVKTRGYSDHDYKKSLCDNTSLAGLVGARAESVAARSGEQGLKIAAQIGKKLRGYNGFSGKDSCDLVSSSLRSKELSEDSVKRVAALIRNERYEKLAEIRNYELREASSRYIIYGKSGDPSLDKAVDSIKPIKEIIEEKSNALEL